MFNTELFNEAVERSGLTRRYIVKELGISYDSFYKKSIGALDWKLTEIQKLKETLGLSYRDVKTIFFGTNVREKRTKEVS